MDKKDLVIYYTQSGQMGEIIDSFTQQIIDEGFSVENVFIKMVDSYQFTWKV